MLLPEIITREEFDEALARYPDLIKSVSKSKIAAEDQVQLNLEQLDEFRFEVAPARYYKKEELEDSSAAPTPLTHADVVQLVRWKLKHGKFRPNLMKLAESNTEDEIKTVTQEAFDTYKKDGFKVTTAINKLVVLKGIGPATASLLLSVHDAARVVFFGDEVFRWILFEGAKGIIKYNAKEYNSLVVESGKLIARLGVDARDVEKVGYVLVREADKLAIAENGTLVTIGLSKASQPKKRKAEVLELKQPTDMTEERKSQLVEVAAKGRAARVAKKQAKLAKGAKFRERVDAAREKKKSEPGTPPATEKAETKVKSDVTTRGIAASAKRSRRSNA